MKKDLRAWIFVIGLVVALPLGVSHAAGTPDLTATIEPVMACSELAERSFGPGVFIDSAAEVTAADGLPAHCEVRGTRFYDAFIVKLPDLWNGRYFQTGNGGAAGSLGDVSMGLKHGFVAASGSGGHTDPGMFDWAYPPDDLEAQLKLEDYCDGSIHKTMIIAKRILEAYYGRSALQSYYSSCSTGGRQGLVEAQRYPYDFDGIVVGAPVNYITRITQRGVWEAQALLPIDGDFEPGKLQSLFDEVMAACDGKDGLVDGLIGDPRKCDFNALSDLPACPDDISDSDCFTLAERVAINDIYTGPPGAAATPGEAFGSELAWPLWVTPGSFFPGGPSITLGFVLGAGFVQWAGLPPTGGGGPSWDWT
ncbi:MAG: tannase/feruloyl esterase family alpha/beta hydrolase, partial [Desulfobacterales bacterium]